MCYVFPPQMKPSPDRKVFELLEDDRDFSILSEASFCALGWDLPDGGRQVRAIAGAAAGGAFDPRTLETVPANALGYRAQWHVVGYEYYGLAWDITGLHLLPTESESGLPTLAIINGGSANWYEFFLDPLNQAGLGQYLAQRIPIILITIPGNYTFGGWTETNFKERIPGYLIGKPVSTEEARIRNAVFTFSLVAEGVRQLLERVTTGPLLILGHSTASELQFRLNNSSLKSRLGGRSIGWGTGAPGTLVREYDEKFGIRADRLAGCGRYPRVDLLRSRDPEGYVTSKYIGPWNPLPGDSSLEVANAWFRNESRRRPQFKQTLQDMEQKGFVEHRAQLEKEIRDALAGNRYGDNANEVIDDLYSKPVPCLTGYQRMAWVVGKLDDKVWNRSSEKARELFYARRFRQENPNAAIRILLIDAPLTHYGHIERPRQLAAVLLETIRWMMQ
jgi:hypothetical protein